MQNSDKTFQELEEVIQKVVDKRISDSVRIVQNVYSLGVVTAIDLSSQTVDVDIPGGGESVKLQYPRNYSSTDIGIGSRVLIASLDNFSGGGKYIIAAYGGF